MVSKYNHRMTTKPIRFVGQDGLPLSNKQITISQTNHEFLFGCGAFDSIPLVNDEAAPSEKDLLKERFEKWLALFNAGTLPFYWGGFEPEKGKTQTKQVKAAATWLKEKGVKVKGHPLCWHTNTAPWLMDMTNDEILKTQLDRIHRDVTEFKGIIDMWDVINEVV